MDGATKDVRLSVTLDTGEAVFLPGECVSLPSAQAEAFSGRGFAVPLYAAPVEVAVPAVKKGKGKNSPEAAEPEEAVNGEVQA